MATHVNGSLHAWYALTCLDSVCHETAVSELLVYNVSLRYRPVQLLRLNKANIASIRIVKLEKIDRTAVAMKKVEGHYGYVRVNIKIGMLPGASIIT